MLAAAVTAAIALSAQTASAPEVSAAATDDLEETVEEAADSSAYKAYTGIPSLDAFINAPVEVFPSIDRMTRMDMADYFNSGSQKPSKNVFKGNCCILSASPDQVTVATTDISQAEISLLPMKGDTIIMLITTLLTPVPDSSVKFYTYPQWEPIEKGLFIVPGLDEWTADDNSTPRADLENAVPFILASLTYDIATHRLVLENKLGDYLPREANDIAKGALKQRLVYQWDGHRMVRSKE